MSEWSDNPLIYTRPPRLVTRGGSVSPARAEIEGRKVTRGVRTGPEAWSAIAFRGALGVSPREAEDVLAAVAQEQDRHSDTRPRARFVGSKLGKYFVGARLAAGGTASVYLARLAGPHNFERLVALKIIHEHLSDEQEFVNMFLDEANLAARLNHPNIVHLYELAKEEGELFLAMEYLHGQPLSQLSERAASLGISLPPDLVAWIGVRAAEGLSHAHELTDADGKPVGLVHRDISPHNIFVTYDGIVKVVDFGIARAEGRIAKTALGQLKGKFGYMSPEQALGHPFDHRADLFALGATLWEVALGARLFKGEDEVDTLRLVVESNVPPARELQPDFPEDLERVLHRALDPDPEQRYSSSAEIARDLGEVIEASGTRDHKQTLSTIITELFAEERANQERAIGELREQAVRVDSEGVRGSESVETQIFDVQPPTESPRRALPLVAAALAVALLVALSVSWFGKDDAVVAAPPPPAPAPSLSADVVIDIQLQPEVPGIVTVGGQLVEARPPKLTLERSDDPVEVVVSAEGYVESRLKIVPDRNRAVLVQLVSVPEPAPAPKEEPAAAGRAAASPKPAGFRPMKPPAPPASPTPPNKPGVITENPF